MTDNALSALKTAAVHFAFSQRLVDRLSAARVHVGSCVMLFRRAERFVKSERFLPVSTRAC